MKTAYKTIFTLSLLCHVFAAEPEHINAPQNTLKVEKTEQQENSFSNFITFKKPTTPSEWIAFGKRYLEFELAQEELNQFEASTSLPKPIETKEFKNKAVIERAQKQVRQKGQCYSLLPSPEQGKQEYGLFNMQDLLSTFNAYNRRYHIAKRPIDEKLGFFPKTMTGEASDISFGFAYQDPTDLYLSETIGIMKQGTDDDAEVTLLSIFENFSDFKNKLSLMKASAGFYNFLRVVLFPTLDWTKITDEIKTRSVNSGAKVDIDSLSARASEESLMSEKYSKPVIAEIVNHYVPEMAESLENGNITALLTDGDFPHYDKFVKVNNTIKDLKLLKELHEQLELLKSLIEELKTTPKKYTSKDFIKYGRVRNILEKFRSIYVAILPPCAAGEQYVTDFKKSLLTDTPLDTLDQFCAFHLGEEKVVSTEKNLETIIRRYLDIYRQTYILPNSLLELDSLYLFPNSNWQGWIFEDLACFVHAATECQAVYLKNLPDTDRYFNKFIYDRGSNLNKRQERLNDNIKELEGVLKPRKELLIKSLIKHVGKEDSLKYLKLAFTKYSLETIVFESLSSQLPEITAAIQQFKESFADQIPILKEEVKQKPASTPSKKKKKKKKAVGQAILECPAEKPVNPEQQARATTQEIVPSTQSLLDTQQSTEGSTSTQELQSSIEAETETSQELNAEDTIIETPAKIDADETSQNPVPVPSIELEEQKQLNQQLRNDLAASRLQLEQVQQQFEAEKKVSTSTSKQYLEVAQELSKLEAEKVELQKNLSDLEAELKSVKQKALQREAEMSTKMAEQARSIVSLSRLVNDLKKENEIVRSQKARIAELEEIAKERLSKNKEKQKELKRAADELEEAEGKIRKLEFFFKAAQDDLVKKEIDLNVYRTKLDALEQSNKTLILQNTSLNLIIQDPDMVLSKFHQFLGEERFQDFLMHLEQSSRPISRKG